MREARKTPVLRGDADHRIEHEHRNVAARDRFERAQARRSIRSRRALRVSCARRRCRSSGSCGRAMSKIVSIASRVVPGTSETIARSSPSSALSSELLPTFGRPMIASASSPSCVAFGASGGKQLDDAVEQVAGAFAVDRRNRNRLAKAQARRIRRAPTHSAFGDSDLLATSDDRAALATQNLRDVFVERMQAGLRVDDEDDDVGFLRGGFGLAARRFGELIAVRHIGVGIDSGRVDHAERPAAPFAERVEAVAGDARGVLDDREALPDQPVEEGALPDVGAADDGDGCRTKPASVGGSVLLHGVVPCPEHHRAGTAAPRSTTEALWPAFTSKRSAAK